MTEPQPILYAEDDENDTILVTRAVEQAALAHPLVVVASGADAIRYLQGTGDFADRSKHPLPCLAMIDLNMPGKSGLEVLDWIRTNEPIRLLPVLILTSSTQDSDIQQSYRRGANGYLVKPGSPIELLTMVRAIKEFWFKQSRLPRMPASG